MKICPVGAELFNADRRVGRTDMTKLTVNFRNPVNAPQIDTLMLQITLCSKDHTETYETLCGQNVLFVNVKPDG
jgi:hypothetical protein